jgi:hypothetical protein
MKTLRITLLLTLTLLLTACSSKSPLLSDSTVQTTANAAVSVPATEGADSYHWRQLSGISVEITDPASPTLSFTAPSVTQEERLVFGLEAMFGDVTQTAEVTVIVHPLSGEDDNDTEDNTTNGGNDDNTTGGGEDNSTSGGNEDNTTGGTDDNSTGSETNTTTPTSLTLTVDATSLNKDANTTLKVEATYSDNTTKDVTDTVAWLINHPDAIQIQSHTLTAKQDKAVTLRAKLDSQTSNAVTLDLYWEVNGHRLPPEPDPTVSNATLLGVDINGNGARDDVERWIYEEYKDKHPIHIDIAMQAARGYRLVLEKQPKTKTEAMSIMKDVEKAADCEAYYKMDAKYLNDTILVKEDIDNRYFRHKIYFNIQERLNIYIKYDALFSGDSYTLPTFEEEKAACDFNASKYDKE